MTGSTEPPAAPDRAAGGSGDPVTVIDLGLDRSPPPPRPARRVSVTDLRGGWRRSRRPVLAVLAASLVLVVAPRPADAGSPLVLAAEQDSMVELAYVNEDLLLVAQGTPGGPAVWSAHRLPAGDYLWTTPGGLMLPAGPGPVVTETNSDAGPVTVVVDRDTGAELWTVTRQSVTPPCPAPGSP